MGCIKYDWFVDENLNLENQMNFHFKNTKKDIILTGEDRKGFDNDNICRFFGKNVEADKVRDLCH